MLEDGLDHGPVLLHELPGALGGGAGRVFHRLRLDEQTVARGRLTEAGDGRSEDGPVEAAHQYAPAAAGQPAGLFDLGHRADLGVHGGLAVRLDAGDEHQQAVARPGGVGGGLGLVALQPEGHDHLRQDHSRRQGEQGQEPGDTRVHVRH